MNSSRIEQLIKHLNDDPNDPFNIYALALEYVNSDRAKAWELFHQLLENHKDYLPTYYQAGKFLAEENKDKAIDILKQGIELSLRYNDLKSKRELQNLLNEILYD